jgi:N-acetyl-gamma-glutamyl-phosphate/LysW-gamma-L-alpha-aminoadipyl-6-phosphate reductase
MRSGSAGERDVTPVRVAIVGGSGYTGGELLRLLLAHPGAEVAQVTSESHAGDPVGRRHPNLRRRTELRFERAADLEPCDTVFACLPHGETMRRIDELRAVGERVVDLSADFRLRSAEAFARWYGEPHARPELLGEFVYGIPELHRDEMRGARAVSSAGCNATAVILALLPLVRAGVVDRERTVAEVKVGTSEAGAASSAASHHPERANSLRSYRPTGHRHTAEIEQELGNGQLFTVHMSATALDMVRGVLATCHVFLTEELDEKAIWRLYRQAYADEPFVRIVKERDGAYRLPEPKILAGTNGCDVGFERDERGRRVVVISALDNLMKGAAGQAVQAFNLMHGFPETTGLEFAGLHPV